MAKRPRVCGKMFHKGHQFDVCPLEHGHEGHHHAARRGFTFGDNNDIIAYDKPFQVPRPGLDVHGSVDEPGSMSPEPPKLDLPKIAGE